MQRCNGLDRVRASNSFYAGLRQPEVFHLSLLDEFFDGSGHIFNRDIRVDAVLVEQIDAIGPETLERSLGDFFDMFRSTVLRDEGGDYLEGKI